jgi:hypothetical protein
MLKNWIKAVSLGLLAFGVICFATIARDPSFRGMSRDGGAFAYCGQQIASGGLLYRDCWDNKPPAIYYVNAAVIAIGGPTQWNLWLAQAIWLAITAVAFYIILRRIWGGSVAFLCTALMLLSLLHPTFWEGGNLTETYALLPIALTLGAYGGYIKTNKRFYLIGIGLFTAISFLFKPTYISAGLAAGLILAYLRFRQRQFRRLMVEWGLILGSFAVPLILVAAYWAAHNELYDLVYAVLIHNQQYVQAGFTKKAFFVTLRIFVLEQPLAALTILALISSITWAVESWNAFRRPHAPQSGEVDEERVRFWFMVGLVVAVCLDVFFTGLSGKNFHHYFQIPMLTLAASSAYLFFTLSQLRRATPRGGTYAIIAISAVFVILLPWAVEVYGKEVPSRGNLAYFLSNPNVTRYQPEAIEKVILEHSQPDQSIFIWGYDPAIYFHVGRRSPSRYIFPQHLFTPTPDGPNGFAEFFMELERDPPVLILSSKGGEQGLAYLGFEEQDICLECPADIRQGVIALKRYVTQYYQPYMDSQDWAVYTRIK